METKEFVIVNKKRVGHDRIYWNIVKSADLATANLTKEFSELKDENKNDSFNFDLQDAIKELLIKHGLAE